MKAYNRRYWHAWGETAVQIVHESIGKILPSMSYQVGPQIHNNIVGTMEECSSELPYWKRKGVTAGKGHLPCSRAVCRK